MFLALGDVGWIEEIGPLLREDGDIQLAIAHPKNFEWRGSDRKRDRIGSHGEVFSMDNLHIGTLSKLFDDSRHTLLVTLAIIQLR